MKKLLFVLLAVLMSSVSFAQFTAATRSLDLNVAKGVTDFPAWQEINTPFVAVDINGDTVDLGAILASGHGVVIDYSGYWCGPCWNVHSYGLLEAIDALTNVDVIWVETTSGTTMADLNGTSSNTQGDWLHTSTGDDVPYPVIIDADNGGVCLATCQAFYANAVPMIIFIAPNGYACDIYGYDYGIYSFDASAVAANVAALMNSYPQAGQAPIANIVSSPRVLVNATANFSSNIVSVDPLTSVTWSFPGATPATATGETASCTWTTPGTYTVTLTATNANGTTTATATVEVYEMGATLGYVTTSTECANAYSLNGGSTTWGVSFDASLMSGRQYLTSVGFYVGYAGNYTLNVYQGGTDAPETLVYTRDYTLTNTNCWQDLNISGALALDQTKSLWVTLTSGVTYCMTVADYTGDVNSDWILYNGQWYHFNEMGYPYSMMITATTGDAGNAGISTLSNVNMNLYPNPTTGILNIAAEGVKEVNVMDVDGRVVMTENSNVIDMTSLENGVYFVRVITANGVSTQKVVKK